jgi:precorrin-6B methylase 2
LGAQFFPTPPSVVKRMLTLACADRDSVLFDLGCGDGGIVVAAARDHGVKKAVGIEKDKRLFSIARRRTAGLENAMILNADYDEVDLSEASIVTIYQSASENARLKRKLLAELSAGRTIVSHAFGFPGWRPREFQVFREGRHGYRIFVYQLGPDTPS